MKRMHYTIEDIKKTNLDDTFLGKYVFRKSATYVTFLLAKTSLTPNQVSILSLILTFISAVFFAQGTFIQNIWGVIFLEAGMILDYCDGQIARLKGLGTKRGAWFDVVLGMIQNNLLVLGIILGLTKTISLETAWIVGFFALFAWNMTCYVHLIAMIFFPRVELKKSALASQVRKGFRINPQYLSIGSDVYFVVFGVAAIFSKLLYGLGIMAILGNLYWLAVAVYLFQQTKDVK